MFDSDNDLGYCEYPACDGQNRAVWREPMRGVMVPICQECADYIGATPPETLSGERFFHPPTCTPPIGPEFPYAAYGTVALAYREARERGMI